MSNLPGTSLVSLQRQQLERRCLPFIFSIQKRKLEENFRMKVEWLVGLPSVCGLFGCPTYQEECGSLFAVQPRGSMDNSLLNQPYIESLVVPLAIFDPVNGKLNQGPLILKLYAGPGRIVSDDVILAKREELFERGLTFLMGLPNATSVQQKMNALYSPFKSTTYARGEKVVQKKLRSRGLTRRNGDQQQASTVLSLNFLTWLQL